MNPSTSQILFVPYIYVIDSPTIAGNGQGISPLVMDEDADFELHWIIGSSTEDASDEFHSNYFTVQITDKSNGRVWSSGRVPQGHISINQGGMRFPRPVLLARRSSLSFDFLNLTANSMVATLTLQGVKLKRG